MVSTIARPLATASGDDQSPAGPFLGRWDLTLKASDHEYPSWLELTQDGERNNHDGLHRVQEP